MEPPRLPLEICLYIIQHVTSNVTLRAISLCCREFRNDAQRALFYHPRVLSTSSPARQQQFIDAVTSSPDRLAPMVHTYVLHHFPTVHPPLVNAALRAMSNLKQLGVLATYQIDFEDIAHYTFKLKTLSWGTHDDVFMASPRVLSAILQNQSSLQCLRAFGTDMTRGLLQIDPRWCPKLQSVAGDVSLFNIVLDGHRPIRSVQWENDPGCEFTLPVGSGIHTTQLPTGLAPVQYFSFTVHVQAPNRGFIQHFRSLVLLEVYVVCESDTEMVGQLDFLENIPNLDYLILTKRVPDYLDKPQPYIHSARRAFSLCNTLHYVDIQRDASCRIFDRFFPPSSISDSREIKAVMVGDDEVYAWGGRDFDLVDEHLLDE